MVVGTGDVSPFGDYTLPPQCKSTNIDWNKKISTYNKCKSFSTFINPLSNATRQSICQRAAFSLPHD